MQVRKRILTLVMSIALIFVLTSCGSSKLNGTYTSRGLITQSFTFDGDNITMSAFGINANGTYEINGNQIVIIYSLLGSEYTWTQPFSKAGDTINIGGTDFVKQ